jgi:hypothetical protein
MIRARGEGKTPHRQIRVDDEPWTRFGDLATTAGTDRSALIRSFISWYLRLPGAKLPRRPSIGDEARGDDDVS